MSCSLHDASKACTKLCSRLSVQSKTVPPACCTCGKPTACGKMICEECCYEPLPVPPAGGEVEVLARIDGMYGDPEAFAERELVACVKLERRRIGTELVDRAHVTRLQAEVSEQSKWRESAEGGWREANRVIAMQRERLDAQESELTKARELLVSVVDLGGDLPKRSMEKIKAFLSNQSAPADKAGYES